MTNHVGFQPIPGKMVTTRDGDAKYAFACGDNLIWLDGQPGATPGGGKVLSWMGKLLGFKNGSPRYGIAEECCEYPPGLTVGFVEQNNWPPYGLSQHLQFIMHAQNACAACDCSVGILTYSGGHWTGTVCGVSVDAYLVTTNPSAIGPPGTVDTIFHADLSGCVSPTVTIGWNVVNTHTDPALGLPSIFKILTNGGSIFPLRTEEQPSGGVLAAGCCNCTLGSFTAELKSFCNKNRVGKLVGFRDGKPRYVVGGCCPPCQQRYDCCDLYAQCPLNATVTITQDYIFNGIQGENCTASAVIPLPLAGSDPRCTGWAWCAGFGFTPACGGWILKVKCDKLGDTCHGGHSDGLAKSRWTIRLENGEPGCNNSDGTDVGNITGTVDVCDCEPLEISITGTNTSQFWNCLGVPGEACCQFTATITVHQ